MNGGRHEVLSELGDFALTHPQNACLDRPTFSSYRLNPAFLSSSRYENTVSRLNVPRLMSKNAKSDT
jgi:hypothetical protein